MTTKLELMRSNYLKKLLTEIVPALAENSPEAALVVVSDPPVDDVLTYVCIDVAASDTASEGGIDQQLRRRSNKLSPSSLGSVGIMVASAAVTEITGAGTTTSPAVAFSLFLVLTVAISLIMSSIIRA
ncbi:hypothetical protein EE612_042509 [Oryza sativa]|uniref:Uncharacterized protein n=1 Tax=Oryza sativa subsp. indica TaxID=39946 RepID=A2YRW8_ORYSI|nr:hypothetical protein OsI_28064 [Oryza sativa Indica Group]KAB8107617.1 hypothetical protein EE612_042509 [Oryza sativa]